MAVTGSALTSLAMESADFVRIGGYASLFGVRDLSGDVVRPGAFCASLRGLARTSPPFLPLFLEHDPRRQVGFWSLLREDALGLWAEGQIRAPGKGAPSERDQDAARALLRLASGRVNGLSIGFRPLRARARADGGRDLMAVDLVEISLVAFPMLPLARARILGEVLPHWRDADRAEPSPPPRLEHRALKVGTGFRQKPCDNKEIEPIR